MCVRVHVVQQDASMTCTCAAVRANWPIRCVAMWHDVIMHVQSLCSGAPCRDSTMSRRPVSDTVCAQARVVVPSSLRDGFAADKNHALLLDGKPPSRGEDRQ